MSLLTDKRHSWCLIDWAFLRPEHVFEDQQRLASLGERAQALALAMKTVFVLREQDRPWWARTVAEHPEATVIEQPFDRGSATAVLVGALHIQHQDPAACVTLLGRGSGRMPVKELLETYRQKTPELYRASASSLGRGRPALDQVYPFIASLELDAVFGV